jgi:transposase
MDVIAERCAGLDVHQGTIVACVLKGAPGQRQTKEVREFGTMTGQLQELRAYLTAAGCTHVGMESTGVYWQPVYECLEDGFKLVVGNAQHIKRVPGRKTDVQDAEWIADLIRHGLIKSSFVPPKPIRRLRLLTRMYRKFTQAQAAERNRTIKVLETANVKLSSVASDVFGVSGMAMLRALVDGKQTPSEMAELALGRLRPKIPKLQMALEAQMDTDRRAMLAECLARLDNTANTLVRLQRLIDQHLIPYKAEQDLLDTIPGIDTRIAAAIIAEIGVDMTAFSSAHHLAHWAGLCPPNNRSAGRQKRIKILTGNLTLKSMLNEAALAASRCKTGYLPQKFRKLAARRGFKRAVVAIAHKLLIAAYHILARRVPYKDLGADYLDRQGRKATTANLVRRLKALGYDVQIQPTATA